MLAAIDQRNAGQPMTNWRPFAVVPTEWREPTAPIVGVQAMHNALRDWLAESQRRAAEGG